MSLQPSTNQISSPKTLDQYQKVDNGSASSTDSSSPTLSSKQALNASILRANLEVSISSKNEPLALVYKTAIEAINKELQIEYGEDAIQTGYDNGLDVSPEATAGRIVSFSTGLFSLYQQQHPEMEEQEQVDSFLDIIGGGIDTGFSEATEILTALDVMEGDIENNIQKTYDLVQEGLAAFRESFLFENQVKETP